jgi:hypothetical protein
VLALASPGTQPGGELTHRCPLGAPHTFASVVDAGCTSVSNRYSSIISSILRARRHAGTGAPPWRMVGQRGQGTRGHRMPFNRRSGFWFGPRCSSACPSDQCFARQVGVAMLCRPESRRRAQGYRGPARCEGNLVQGGWCNVCLWYNSAELCRVIT